MLRALSDELLKWCDSLVRELQTTQNEMSKKEEEIDNCTDLHELWLRYCKQHHIRLAVTPFADIIATMKAKGAMSDPVVSGVIRDYNNYWEAFTICNRNALTLLKQQNKHMLDRFRNTATLAQMLSCEYWHIAKEHALTRFQLVYLEPSHQLQRKRKVASYQPNDGEAILIKKRKKDELLRIASALQYMITVVGDRQEYDKARKRRSVFELQFQQYQTMVERMMTSMANAPPALPTPFPFEDFVPTEEDEPFTNLNEMCKQTIGIIETLVTEQSQDDIVAECRRFTLQTCEALQAQKQEYAKDEFIKDQQQCTLYVNLNTRICQLEWHRDLIYLVDELDPFIQENAKAYPDVLQEFGRTWETFKMEQMRFFDNEEKYIIQNLHAVQKHITDCFTLAVTRDAQTFTLAITETILGIIKQNKPDWREQVIRMIPTGLRVTVHQSCDLLAQAEREVINATRRMIERTKADFMKDTFETISYLLLDLKALLSAKEKDVTHVTFNELEQIRQQNFPVSAFSHRPIGEISLSLLSVIQEIQKTLSVMELKKDNVTRGVRGHATKFGLFYHMLSKPSTEVQQVWKAIPDALCTASWIDINQ